MHLAICPICGLAAGPSDSLCRKCGNSLLPPREGLDTRGVSQGLDESGETYKFVALGIFIGCLIAGSLVLWLMLGSSHSPKASDEQPPVNSLSVTPQPTAPLGSASDQDSTTTETDNANRVIDRLRAQHHRRRETAAPKASGYGSAEVYTGHGKTPTMIQPE